MKLFAKRRDQRMMGRALALAALDQGLTGENPSVGCVILDKDGHIVGEGVTGQGADRMRKRLRSKKPAPAQRAARPM